MKEIMIKRTILLNDRDWENLNGNSLFITMLRNKIKCDVDKKDSEDTTKTSILEYLEEVPENFVYYIAENIYGWLKYEIYFENALDMENFIHFYNTTIGLNEIQK